MKIFEVVAIQYSIQSIIRSRVFHIDLADAEAEADKYMENGICEVNIIEYEVGEHMLVGNIIKKITKLLGVGDERINK